MTLPDLLVVDGRDGAAKIYVRNFGVVGEITQSQGRRLSKTPQKIRYGC